MAHRGWNFADVFCAVARVQPDAIAVRQGERTRTYDELHARVAALGSALAAGSAPQDTVAVYLHNCPESVETTLAALHHRLVPVNTNYRYGDEELAYLFDNADCVTVVFHGTHSDRAGRLRDRCAKVRRWIHVDDGSGPRPEWAEPYEALATASATPPATCPERSGEDLLLLYTGGTTGMPKGVMWTQDALFRRLNGGGVRRFDLGGTLEDVERVLRDQGHGARVLVASPLMHGTGLFSALETLAEGGELVLLASRHFDADEFADTIERNGVAVAVIVGDPFARPLLEALRRARPERIASLVGMISSGAMWSREVKAGLLECNPKMTLIDAFSSSEALGMGTSVTVADAGAATAQFSLGPGSRVLDADGRDVVPGSGQAGLLAVPGQLPLGYYKDEEKTASIFKTIDGVRYSVPGDWATVRADGSIQLLGRGSQCINTAGEKVFPEEVEEALKRHPSVRDACVLGLPDPRAGEVVVAVVEPIAGAMPREAELVDHVRAHLAHYKAPRRVRIVDTIGRTPSGKMDYARHRREFEAWVAEPAPSA